MKKILIALSLILCSMIAKSQGHLPGWLPMVSKTQSIGVMADSLMYMPIKDTTFIPQRIGAYTMRPQDSCIYVGIKSSAGGKHWEKYARLIDAAVSNTNTDSLFGAQDNLAIGNRVFNLFGSWFRWKGTFAGDSVILDSVRLKYIDGNQGAGKVLMSSATGSASWQFGNYYSYPINIDSLGAIGDGSTDNATIFKSARNLSRSTGRPILIPSGTYYTSDSTGFNKQTVFGYGVNSIIKVTSATVTPIYLKDSCFVYGVKFIGTGAGAVPGGVVTTQNGIRIYGHNNLVQNNYFTSITGSGVVIFEDAAATVYRNTVIANKIDHCTIGIFSLANDEYGLRSNNDINACTVGEWDRSSGNSRWVNETIQYCTVDGFRLTGGGNGDHASVIGCSFNHNVTNVNIESTNLGQMFVGCNIEASNGGNLITFGSVGTANQVIFSECNLYLGNIAGTSASQCVVRDCNILPGGGGVTHSGSGVTYVNNNASTDAQYWKSDLNAVGAAGLIGTSDNYSFTVKTNNTSRVTVLNSGEVDISNTRFQTAKGADVAAANDLTLGAGGNIFHITGSTTINAITTASWQAGSEITLIFDSTPTVKNNTAGGGGTAVMILPGGADLSATANDVLKLVYDGTKWYSVSWSVN